MRSTSGNAYARTEFYDSLCISPDKETLDFLKEAIEEEYNEMARSYAIILWTEVSRALGMAADEILDYIHALEGQYDLQQSEYCLNSCYYAEYLLGEQTALNKMKGMLNSTDERVRCATMCLLEDVFEHQRS